MKKMKFGRNDDARLNSSWSGIERYNGEYLGMFACDDADLLVTRIVDSYNGQLDGNIDVREIAQDYYADGSFALYSNRGKSEVVKKIEDLLNTETMKQRLAEGKSPYILLGNEGLRVHYSHLHSVEPISDGVSTDVTSITPEKFKELKDSKRYAGGRSMYYLIQEVAKLRQELASLKGEDNYKR